MAVYFDHQVQAPEGSYRHEQLEWHPKFSLLALASYNDSTGGEVNLFFEEGERTKDTPVRKAAFHVTKLSWHATKKILAIGWSSGDVTIWNLMDKAEIFAVTPSTNGEVAGLEWSSEGSKLLITDTSGLVLVYKADNKGHPQNAPFSKNKLKEPIRCLVLRPPVVMERRTSVVNEHVNESTAPKPRKMDSDEPDSLDAFGFKKHGRALITPADSGTFFLGGDTGGVYCLRDSGVAEECFDLEKTIVKMLFHKDKSTLITVTDDLTLCQHHVAPDSTLRELSKVKLSSKNQKLNIIWAGSGILALSSGENQIRLWDIDNEENCVLSLSVDKGYNANDTINCISYCSVTGILAGGTNLGKIAMWRPSKIIASDLSEQFKLQPPSILQGIVNSLQWAHNSSMLAVSTSKEVFILKEQIMCSHMKSNLLAVQTSQNTINVTRIDKLSTGECRPSMQPKGIFLGSQHLACWDGHKVCVYENVDSGSPVLIGSFQSNSSIVAVHNQSLYLCEPTKVQVKTFQGTVKQTLPLADEENDPCSLDVAGHFLAVGTSTGFIRVYDLSRREAKQQSHPKYIAEGIADFGSISSVKINISGNRVSCTMKKTDGSPDPKLYVWDIESDAVIYYDFNSAVTDQEEYENQTASATGQKKEETRFNKDLKGRYPAFHAWEATDPRFLITEALPMRTSARAESAGKTQLIMNDVAESMIVSFFVTAESGILLQDAFAMSSICDKLIGIEIPYVYFVKKSEYIGDAKVGITEFGDLEKAITRSVIRRTCRDFVGLENADKTTKEAMLNFSYYLTIGNMDEAFKAIKLIKSESVWENMAQMCVKTQRLDVAAVCLGNMGNARGAKSLRKLLQSTSTEPEAKVAMLAVQLGMTEDAERLYSNGKRYDMVNKLQQATNNWKKAIEISENKDRVHLRNTYYAYAKHLESVGAVQGAIEYYEKSDTQRFEVPRMLLDNAPVLKEYIEKTKDLQLQKWWAQYAESLGELDSARQFYSSAKDYLSVVRLLCYSGDAETAATVANESNDKAACYHLARQYENGGQFKDAVHFFTKANAYSSAIRLCKEHGMDDKIAQLALMGRDSDMIEAAKFYENKIGQADKAVMLYHKAGMFGRALDLAFRTEQFSALDLIAADLDETSDPRVLERCAEFFVQNQQYTKAVQLLGYAKKYAEAIDLCAKRNVQITEQFAELLTPTKEVIPDTIARNKLMEQLADVCMQQGVYHYAAKKYTQSGSRTQAMKALLKSGDTEKIIFFANTARTKEIYIMAGNYLQTLDWKQDPEIMKSIVTFYTKGQAPESLAGFYDACAQVEIDEYRDYEKAMIALQEAAKCLTRGRDPMQMEGRISDINRKIEMIKQFLKIREIYEADPAEAMKQLQTLAQDKNINEAIRLGDIYAVLIIHNVKKDNYKKAHSYLEELRKRSSKIDITRYVKPQIIEKIYREMNLPAPNLNNSSHQNDGDNEDYVPETQGLMRKLNIDNKNGVANGEIE